MLWIFGSVSRGACRWLCVCVLLICLLVPLYAENFASITLTLNGSEHAVYSVTDLASSAYPVVQEAPYTCINPSEQLNGQPIGITLDELFPLMVDAWNLTTDFKGNRKSIDNPHLAEHLPYYVLLVGTSDESGQFYLIENSVEIALEGEISTDSTLDIWISWEGVSELKKEIERFASNHQVTINTLEVPKISSKLIQTQRGGGSVPDVVMIQSDYVEELVQSESLQSLNYMDVLSFQQDGIDSFNLFGEQWAIPFYFDTQALIGNMEIFSRVGIDAESIRSLADLEQTAQRIKDYADRYDVPITPMSWNVYSAYWFLPFQYGFGKKQLVEQNGSLLVADQPSIDAMRYLLSLIDRSLLAVQERDSMLSQFVSGNIGIMMSASYMIPELEKIGVPFFIIPLPQNQNTGAYVTPISDYKGLAITKRSRNPLLARRLVQYLTGLGVQYRFTMKVNKLPSVSAVSKIEWQESEVRKAVKRSASYANPIPPDRAYSIYKNVMWSMIRLILDHKFSGIEGLEEAERLINVQITDYLQQLPQHYRSYYSQSEGEKNDEWEMEKTENERVDDASSTTTDRGFFTWLRSLW